MPARRSCKPVLLRTVTVPASSTHASAAASLALAAAVTTAAVTTALAAVSAVTAVSAVDAAAAAATSVWMRCDNMCTRTVLPLVYVHLLRDL